MLSLQVISWLRAIGLAVHVTLAKRARALSEAAYRTQLLAQIRRLHGDALMAWNAAYTKLNRQASTADLLAAVEADDLMALERLFGLSKLGGFLRDPKLLGKPVSFGDISRRCVLQVADSAAKRLTSQLSVPIEASYMRERAGAWLRNHGFQFAQQMTAEAQGALRATMAGGFDAGLSPARIVESLRQNLPLTEQWAGAVTRYEKELIEAGVKSSQARQLAGTYAKRLRTRRAQNIVQTELHDAARQAEHDLIEESALRGLIDKEIYEREWVAILTGNVCKACHGAHGLRAPIGGSFPNGRRMTAMHPVNDRCSEKLVRKDESAPSVPAFVELRPGASLRPITPSEAAKE